MNLNLDTSRCAGIRSSGRACEFRGDCARYRQIERDIGKGDFFVSQIDHCFYDDEDEPSEFIQE